MTTTSKFAYTGYYSINGEEPLVGWSARTHNAAVRGTRQLFTGEGFRIAPDSGNGRLIIQKSDGTRAVIWVEVNH